MWVACPGSWRMTPTMERGLRGCWKSSLVLIDGQQLASLMIEYGVGVSVQRIIKIARLDSDYFEEG